MPFGTLRIARRYSQAVKKKIKTNGNGFRANKKSLLKNG